MRRWSIRICFCALFLFFAAVPHSSAQETKQNTVPLDIVNRWKVVNFVIFAIGLGYFIAKYSPRFFDARSLAIQKAIEEATGLKLQAEMRHSEIDRQMATLPAEVEKLREHAQAEMGHEHALIQHETELEIDHIHRNLAAEIEAIRRESMRQIRQHTAGLALDLAARQLQQRFASGEAPDLIHDFVHLVERGKN